MIHQQEAPQDEIVAESAPLRYPPRPSPFGRWGNERRVLIAVKAYFDSSGKSIDPNSQYVTLASVKGDEPKCDRFESAWHDLLQKFPGLPTERASGLPYVHTADLIREPPPNLDVRSLLSGCLDCIQSSKLSITSSSVPLENWVRHPSVRKLRIAEWLCLDWHLATMLLSVGEQEIVQLYFDRDEDYIRLVQLAWDSERHRNARSWLARVSVITPVASNITPEIQAADIVAWSLNSQLTGNRKGDWLYAQVREKLTVSHQERTVDALRTWAMARIIQKLHDAALKDGL